VGDDDDPADPRLDRRADEAAEPFVVRRDDREGSERDDRDVARLERVEGRHPGSHQADPRQVGARGRIRPADEPPCVRQDRRPEAVERGHASR